MNSTGERRVLEIVHELHNIPHLKLPLQFDPLKMQAEVNSIVGWTPYAHAGYKNISAEDMRAIAKGYSGVCLYEFNGRQDYATDNYEVFKGLEPEAKLDGQTKEVLFLPTPLVEQMPYTASVVGQVTERKGRTRIMRSLPQQALAWHSHNRGPWVNSYMHEAIVHIPIKTEKEVFHAVRDYRHPQAREKRFSLSTLEELTGDPQIFAQNYGAGECWLFNSWHDHYYHNYSSSVRYSLVMYLRWFYNEPFIAVVEKALSGYRGPRLPEDSEHRC